MADAGATATLAENLTADQQTNTVAIAQAAAARDNAYAQALAGTPAQGGDAAQPGYWDAQTAAENALATARAVAGAAWQSASCAAQVNACCDVLALGYPLATSDVQWFTFQAYLAQSRQAWWGDSSGGACQDYLDYTANVNAQYTEYQDTVDAAYLAKAGAPLLSGEGQSEGLTGADTVYAASAAAADVACVTAKAQAQAAYNVSDAVATETYLDAVAGADRDYAVNSLPSASGGGGGTGDPAAQHTAALAAASSAYLAAEAAADTTLQTGLATADFNYTTAYSSPLSSGEGANLVYTSAVADANFTYTTAESNAYAALQTALSGRAAGGAIGLGDAFADQNAASYAAAMGALAAAHPSPWATFAAAQSAAAETLVSADMAALAAMNQAAITATNTEELADAAAVKTRASADALAFGAWQMAKATAAYGLALARVAAENLTAALGQYQAELPVGPDLPAIDAQAVERRLGRRLPRRGAHGPLCGDHLRDVRD